MRRVNEITVDLLTEISFDDILAYRVYERLVNKRNRRRGELCLSKGFFNKFYK